MQRVFLLSYKEFLSLYKVPVTPKDFAIVLDAIFLRCCFIIQERVKTWPLEHTYN